MTLHITYENATLEDLDIEDRNREIRHLLNENVCEVTFTKVNGELRTMPCTLKPDAMPQMVVNETHQTRLFKPETLSVWCIDKGEWRAFKVANVKEIRVVG